MNVREFIKFLQDNITDGSIKADEEILWDYQTPSTILEHFNNEDAPITEHQAVLIVEHLSCNEFFPKIDDIYEAISVVREKYPAEPLQAAIEKAQREDKNG